MRFTRIGRSPLPRRMARRALYGYYLFQRLALSDRVNRNVRKMARHRSDFYAQIWKEAAEATESAIASAGNGFFRVTRGTRSIFVNSNQSLLDSHVAVSLADDKATTYRLLAKAQIPVPEHVVISPEDFDAALGFAKSLSCPVVVKPAFGTSGGTGVSTDVRTAPQLMHAIAWAAAFCSQVIVERQIEGETYRLLYLDGELLDCVLRRSPRLVGDGAASVRDLVHSENSRRLSAGYQRSQALLNIDQDMKTTLALQGLRLGAVPENRREFVVKRVVNENIASENETVTGGLCSEIVEIGRRVAETLGLRLAGLDVITSDLRLPLHKVGGAVVDVNAVPGFYYHYLKKDRFPVAYYILKWALGHAASARQETRGP